MSAARLAAAPLARSSSAAEASARAEASAAAAWDARCSWRARSASAEAAAAAAASAAAVVSAIEALVPLLLPLSDEAEEEEAVGGRGGRVESGAALWSCFAGSCCFLKGRICVRLHESGKREREGDSEKGSPGG